MASLHGLRIPTAVATLVVPAATVAEVVATPADLHPLPDAPRGVVGRFIWRNRPVILLSFERLAAGAALPTFARVCVLHPIPGRRSPEHIALIMNREPHSIEIMEAVETAEVPGNLSREFAAGAVRVGEETLVIPDFDALAALTIPERL